MLNYLKTICYSVLLGLDQLLNALLGGHHDETISSRCGRLILQPDSTTLCRFCHILCPMLHLLDKNHCVKNIELDETIGAKNITVLPNGNVIIPESLTQDELEKISFKINIQITRR